MRLTPHTFVLTSALVIARCVHADVAVLHDMASWSAAIDDRFHTITFTEIGAFAFLDDQYADFDIAFPETNDQVFDSPDSPGLRDFWGVYAFDFTITIDFAMDAHWIAFDYGSVADFIRLYNDGELIEEAFGGIAFTGIVSDAPFDRVVFVNPSMDDLHVPIGRPGGLPGETGGGPRPVRPRESARAGSLCGPRSSP